ncbi:MAG: hypothetical protein ABIW17_03560 [Marmoricola sp.]
MDIRPNPGHGFSLASSDASQSSVGEHEAAIHDFLAQVDTDTGCIE